MSMQVSYKKQIFFGVLFLIILFFSIETFMRTYEYVSIPCGLIENDAFSNLNYFEIKNICYDTNTLVHGKAPLYHIVPNQIKFTMNINSDGFRGPEISNEEKYRIFFTGGSTAFGFGSISDNTTISGYLQTMFDNDPNGLNVEIINAGINGANGYREILLIKEKLVNFNPDMIISYTGTNDSGGYIKEIILDVESDDWKPDWLKFGNYPWFRTAFVINYLLEEKTPDIQTNFSLDMSSTEIKNLGNIFESNWSQSCNFLQENNVKSVVVLQPVLKTKKSPSEFEKNFLEHDYNVRIPILNEYSSRLNDLSEKCSYVIDLRNGTDDTYDTTYYDSVHMNSLGNQLVAEKIFSKILPIVINNIESQKNN